MTETITDSKIPKGKTLLYLGIPLFILVTVGFLFFSSAGRDDAHITYWAAHSLAEYGEILNYNGNRVEQSSSLLQVLIMAMVNKITGLQMINLGILLSLIFAMGSIVGVYRLTLKIEKSAAFYAALLTGTSVYLVYWAYGGLETTLVSCCVLILLTSLGNFMKPGTTNTNKERSLLKRLAAPAGASFLYLLVRPESPVVLFCLLLGAWATVLLKRLMVQREREFYRDLMKALVPLSLVFVVESAVVFLFRWWYFDGFFPQPVAAKSIGLSREVLTKGLLYLKKYLFTDLFITLLTLVTVAAICFALFKLIKGAGLNIYVLLSLLFIAANTSFIALAGGDWMEGGRFLVHQLPLGMMLISLLLLMVLKSKQQMIAGLGVLLLLQGITVYNFARRDSTGMPAWCTGNYYKASVQAGEPLKKFNDFSWFERYNRVHIRDIPTVIYLDRVIESIRASGLKEGPVTLMSGQAGMVAYYITKKYFKKISFIDRHGLTDRTLTECKVTNSARRYSMGLYFQYQHFFNKLKSAKKMCGIKKPDIIFDLKFKDAKYIIKQGYTMVYSQEGVIPTGSALFPGWKMYFDQFIAVRNDLLKGLSGFAHTHSKYEDYHET